jgi:hypothetical protein
MMRLILALSLLLVLPLASLALLLALTTSPTPQAGQAAAFSVADMERGRRVWKTLAPARLKEGEERQVTLSSRDVNLGLAYLAGRLGLAGAKVDLSPDALSLRASARLPGLPQARYLNLELAMAPRGPLLAPARLRLGSVPLPAEFTTRLLGWGLALSPVADQVRVARAMLRAVDLDQDRLRLTFVWHGQALEAAMAQSAGLDMTALAAYRQRLATLPGRDLAPLLGEVFALARQRSQAGDPVAENRAALTALAERVTGTRLVTVGGVEQARRGGGIRLAGRTDFAQHFALSAFMAATGGEGLADAAGLYKELRDAREGSGFSFNDLAADRAGSRLGEAASRSRSSAEAVQAKLAGVASAQAFFPRVDDLPEFMNQAEFVRRYGGVGAPAYEAMAEKIEARIAGLPLYR